MVPGEPAPESQGQEEDDVRAARRPTRLAGAAAAAVGARGAAPAAPGLDGLPRRGRLPRRRRRLGAGVLAARSRQSAFGARAATPARALPREV